jgi:hypothetical protein
MAHGVRMFSMVDKLCELLKCVESVYLSLDSYFETFARNRPKGATYVVRLSKVIGPKNRKRETGSAAQGLRNAWRALFRHAGRR